MFDLVQYLHKECLPQQILDILSLRCHLCLIKETLFMPGFIPCHVAWLTAEDQL